MLTEQNCPTQEKQHQNIELKNQDFRNYPKNQDIPEEEPMRQQRSKNETFLTSESE